MLRNTLTLLIIAVVFFVVNFAAYPSFTRLEDFYGNYSIEKAVQHVQQLSLAPGHIGTATHTRARRYVVRALQDMGLEVQMQKTTSLNNRRSSPIANVLARIEGSDDEGKALLLMSHYDDATYSSPGAADASSGVATILEGVRAFLQKGTQPKNDIIILITDGEELGLLGAKAFVDKHAWAQDIGLVLNFEARGTAGPAYMLIETETGNQQLLKAFKATDTPFPVSNSFAYEIYKMLPNDTDMTELRKLPGVHGYNFAFIDDHFNYHTSRDALPQLSLDSMAHQATYLVDTLNYFANQDLTTLQSDADQIFFSIPRLGIIDYPAAWSIWIAIATAVLALLVILLGMRKKHINGRSSFQSLLDMVVIVAINVAIAFALLSLASWLHPKYKDIIQGFPYNGYWYVYAIISFSVITTILFYSRQSKSEHTNSIIPALLWLLLGGYLVVAMPGASFLIIICICALLMLAIRYFSPKLAEATDLLLLLPVLVISAPLVFSIPTALGLKAAWISALLVTLIIAAMASTIASTRFYKLQFVWLAIPLWFVAKAEMRPEFTVDQPAQSSLAYWLDSDNREAWWLTNDQVHTDWNKAYFAEVDTDTEAFNSWRNQYFQWTNKRAKAPVITTPKAQVDIIQDRTYLNERIISIRVKPPQGTNQIRLLAPQELHIQRLDVNRKVSSESDFTVFANRPIIRHYMATEHEVILDMTVTPDTEITGFELLSYIPGLEDIEELGVRSRSDTEMPMAFVHTDVMIVKQSVALTDQQ